MPLLNTLSAIALSSYGFSRGSAVGDKYIAIAYNTSPRILVYPWSAGFGTKYANPATLPGNQARATSFSLTGGALAVTSLTTSPNIHVYPWSAGFGTKYADPSTLPTTEAYGVTFG